MNLMNKRERERERERERVVGSEREYIKDVRK